MYKTPSLDQSSKRLEFYAQKAMIETQKSYAEYYRKTFATPQLRSCA